MDTRECRHCKLTLQPGARRCPHCHGHQGWVADQRDPRFFVSFAVVIVLPLVAAALFMMFHLDRKIRSLDNRRPAPVAVSVSDHSFRFVSTPDGTRVFVLGHLANAGETDASEILLRVSLLDEADRLLDTALLREDGLTVRAGTSEPFRLTGLVAPGPAEVKRVDVAVVRARGPSPWD